jgi:DNA-binding transcriptional ArsR family regulator
VVAKAVGKKKKTIEGSVRFALGHKTRVEVLMALNDGVYTVAELSEILGVPANALGNHLLKMLEDGSIEIAKEERRGNVVTYWYKAVELPVYSQAEAEAMTPQQRQATVGAILQRGSAEVFGALEAGKLADPRSILYWHWYNVDAQGREEIEDISLRFLEELREVEVRSTNRRVKSREDATTMLVDLAVFERVRAAITKR